FTYYTGNSKGFHCMPRGEVMQHFIRGQNIGLVFRRQSPKSKGFYVFISDKIISDGYIRSDNKGGESVAPLYLYPEDDGQQTLDGQPRRTPNLDAEIVQQIADGLGLRFVPEKENGDRRVVPEASGTPPAMTAAPLRPSTCWIISMRCCIRPATAKSTKSFSRSTFRACPTLLMPIPSGNWWRWAASCVKFICWNIP